MVEKIENRITGWKMNKQHYFFLIKKLLIITIINGLKLKKQLNKSEPYRLLISGSTALIIQRAPLSSTRLHRWFNSMTILEWRRAEFRWCWPLDNWWATEMHGRASRHEIRLHEDSSADWPPWFFCCPFRS